MSELKNKLFDVRNLPVVPPTILVPELYSGEGKNPFLTLANYYLDEIISARGVDYSYGDVVRKKLVELAKPMSLTDHQNSLGWLENFGIPLDGPDTVWTVFSDVLYTMGLRIDSQNWQGDLTVSQLLDPDSKKQDLKTCVAISMWRYGITGISCYFTIGKFRNGVHSEHLKTLRLIKQAQSKVGRFTVLVEAKSSIQARLGKSVEVLDDEERLDQVAESPFVDLVALVGAETDNAEEVNQYYEQIWRRFFPGTYVMGAHNDPLFPVLAERSRRTGVLLRWAREVNKVSTTSNVAMLTGA